MIVRAALFIYLIASALAEDFVLLDNGSEWNYLHDASDQGTAWREVDFDDTAWTTGLAPFGQGPFTEPMAPCCCVMADSRPTSAPSSKPLLSCYQS